jgi:hypothetical protein
MLKLDGFSGFAINIDAETSMMINIRKYVLFIGELKVSA